MTRKSRSYAPAAALLLLAPLAAWLIPAGVSPAPAANHGTFADHRASRLLTSYVDPFIGTAGEGNTFPGATVPHGMIQWSPETTAGGLFRPGGYNSGDLIIRGFALTHLSGAGCVAFANLPIMPTVRPMVAAPQPNGSPYSDRFVPRSEQASPGYYSVRLASGIETQLTATARTGFGHFTFPDGGRPTILIDAGNAAGARTNIDGADAASIALEGQNQVVGWTRGGHFCGLGNEYSIYFAARFDHPFSRFGVWQRSRLAPGRRGAAGRRVGAYVEFAARTVQVKVGLSYVSVGEAERNLAAESQSWHFDDTRRSARARWNTLLNRIQVSGGTDAQRRVFYTALYHSLLAPTTFSDADGMYRGFDGKVHRARGYTVYANFSGWDIYRSEIPLLAWLEPKAASDMMQSLVDDAREGGWLPKWPVANSYTGEMDGDSADPILAGAMAFGATAFDRRAALRAMLKGATNHGAGPDGYRERPELASYLRNGFAMPATGGWGSAAETLEYATDDYAIARMAATLGDRKTAKRFLGRSHGWRRLFNSATGFIEPRASPTTFPTGFNPTSSTGFVEGDAWQYLWMVPHDLAALVHLLGGARPAATRLDRLFRHLNAGPNAPYYWAGNEPGLATPWEYDFLGRPDKTRAVVRRIMSSLYRDAGGGLPGNDDLGALSSWYVWAALGAYPETPGVAGLALAAPIFPAVTLHYATGRTLRFITLPAVRPEHPNAPIATLDGRPLTSAWLALSRLHTNSTMVFWR